jgi:SAM-dependent methyltransferase
MDAKPIASPLRETPRRLARRYPRGYERHYVFWKLLLDPVYEAVLAELAPAPLPVLDIGCGPGLLAAYLRGHGFHAPIHGVDYDAPKIELTRRVLAALPAVSFAAVDARESLPDHLGHVTMLDTLQFFEPDELEVVLERAAARIAPGGKLIIRTTLSDSSWRFRLSRLGDWLAKVTFWMKDHPRSYPARDDIVSGLERAGLTGSARRLSGRIPFNNFLLVFSRPAAPVPAFTDPRQTTGAVPSARFGAG